MATIQGTGGSVTIAGYNGKMNSWSADLSIEDVETSGFTDAVFRTFEPVIVSLTGSATATGERDTATDAPAPTLSGLASAAPVAIVLTAQSGNTWSFSAVVSSVSYNRAVDGKLELTFNFESSGRVTQAWT